MDVSSGLHPSHDRHGRQIPGSLEKQPPDVVENNNRPNDESRQLQDCYLVPRRRHASQAAGGSLELRAHGRKRVGLRQKLSVRWRQDFLQTPLLSRLVSVSSREEAAHEAGRTGAGQ